MVFDGLGHGSGRRVQPANPISCAAPIKGNLSIVVRKGEMDWDPSAGRKGPPPVWNRSLPWLRPPAETGCGFRKMIHSRIIRVAWIFGIFMSTFDRRDNFSFLYLEYRNSFLISISYIIEAFVYESRCPCDLK